jgi:predicted TPR repeat methyltransferase
VSAARHGALAALLVEVPVEMVVSGLFAFAREGGDEREAIRFSLQRSAAQFGHRGQQILEAADVIADGSSFDLRRPAR